VHALGGLNASNTTSFPFRIGAEVVPVETVVYYVANAQDSVPPTLPENTRSLYRRAGDGDAEELVQGVEQMQVEYGVDLDGDRIVDEYREAPNVTDWQRVISVQIALLVRSIQQYGTDTDQRTYQLLTNTTVAAPGDRRIREVFQATVSLRNRLRVD
jgi:type IV pilus assembly protein PilW